MAKYKGPSDKMTDVTMQGGRDVAQARMAAADQTLKVSAQSQQQGNAAVQTLQHREDKKQEYQQHQEREVAATDRQSRQIQGAHTQEVFQQQQANQRQSQQIEAGKERQQEDIKARQEQETFRQQREDERQRRQMAAQGIEFDPVTGAVRHNNLGMSAEAKRQKDSDISESRLQLDMMKYRTDLTKGSEEQRLKAQEAFDSRFYTQRNRLDSAAERLRLAQYSGDTGDALADLAGAFKDRPDLQAAVQAAKGGDTQALSRVIEDYQARIGAMDIDYIAATGKIPQGMNYNGQAFLSFQSQREGARTLLNYMDKAFEVGGMFSGVRVSNPFGKTPSERQEYLNRIAAQAVAEQNVIAAVQAQFGSEQQSPSLPPAGAPAGTPQSSGAGKSPASTRSQNPGVGVRGYPDQGR